LLPAISAEVEAAQRVKDREILVIVGNPPYSGHSKNKGAWITAAIDGYKFTLETDKAGAEDKKPLGERNPKTFRQGTGSGQEVLNVCASKLPQDFAKPFNLYDLARQFFDETVDEKTGKTWDIVVGGLVKQTVTDSPFSTMSWNRRCNVIG
jgi:hypothetical protein